MTKTGYILLIILFITNIALQYTSNDYIKFFGGVLTIAASWGILAWGIEVK